MGVSGIESVAISNPELVGEIDNNQRNLTVEVVSGTNDKVVVDFDNLILRDTYGQEVLLARKTTDTSITIDGDTVGLLGRDTASAITINTWYYIWIIFNKTTRTISAILSSVSPTSVGKPTLPEGYTYYRRVGAVFSLQNTTANFSPMKQFEDYVYANDTMRTISSSLTAGAWTSLDITYYVPRTAKSIRVCFAGNSQDSYGISPNSSGFGGKYFKERGETTGTAYGFGLFTSRYNQITMECPVAPASTVVYYFVNFSSGSTGEIYSLGYTDNLELYY